MKVLPFVLCCMIVFAGCIRRDSDVSRFTPPPQLLDPLFELYSDQNIAKLENLHDTSKVSDTEVKDIKNYLHTTLAKIITSLPAKIDHRNTLISYIPGGKIISYHAVESLCAANDRSKCFRLEIIPEQFPNAAGSFIIKVWQLPANADIAKVSKSYTEDSLPTLFDALRGSFPHRLGLEQEVVVRHYGREKDKTLHVIAGAEGNGNRRELHIKVSDGMIDNTQNALFPHLILPGDVALLDDPDDPYAMHDKTDDRH